MVSLTDVSAGLYMAFVVAQLGMMLATVIAYEKLQQSLVAVLAVQALVVFATWLFLPGILAGFGV